VAAPAPSTLSRIGQILRDRLKKDAFPPDTSLQVTIGPPGAMANNSQESTETNVINLFFYRIEPAGFHADTRAGDRWYVRVFCLITAFSVEDPAADPKISAGESDLRLLGEVLRYFHETPIIVPKADEDDVGSQVQAVFSPLSSEEINQIWSTQGDVPYRASLRYEFALLPIEPKTFAVPSLPVAAGGAHLHGRATMAAARQPPPDPPAQWISPVLESGMGADWVPALAFVLAGKATQSLKVDAAQDLTVPVWVAGPKNAKVDFVWEHVHQGTWAVPANGIIADTEVPEQLPPVDNHVIDPLHADKAEAVDVPVVLPPLGAGQQRVQLLLHAERPVVGGPALRSNPLILTVELP
jgi:hypothetical protein